MSFEPSASPEAVADERARIARALHDGPLQTLLGTNLALEACRDHVRRGRTREALALIDDLETRVTHEYGELRDYVHVLAEGRTRPAGNGVSADTWVTVRAHFAGPIALVDHVVQILREGIANIRKHAHARSADVAVRGEGSDLVVTLNDDGVGMPSDALLPWSISSRVRDLGGTIEGRRNAGQGAHLVISLRRG